MTGPEVTQPDPDGGVEMTDGEWAAFRGVEAAAAMKAEGVPKALVERMAAAICPNSRPEHKGVTYCIACFKRAGDGLAAVLPEIQAQAQQALIADLLARDLADVEYLVSRYPIRAVPQAALLEHRNRIARKATTTEETTT